MAGEEAPMTPAQIEAWQRNGGARLLSRVGLRAGDVVLDFGCRFGNYAGAAALAIGPGGKVYGLDKNPDALAELVRRMETSGLGNVVPLETSGGFPIPLEADSADAVLLYDVVHLIGWSDAAGGSARRSTSANREALFAEVLRILKPEGVLSVYCPHLPSHTDVRNEQEIADEIEAAGFRPRDGFEAELLHDDRRTRGHVMNFVASEGRAGRTAE